MSYHDGKWDHDPKVLACLNEIANEGVSTYIDLIRICENRSERSGLFYEGILYRLHERCGLKRHEVNKMLDEWNRWVNWSWTFKCERCGAEHEADGRRDYDHCTIGSIGCACGAIYEITGWKEYHRDDTGGGRVSVGVAHLGDYYECDSLEDADDTIEKLQAGIMVREVSIRKRKR